MREIPGKQATRALICSMCLIIAAAAITIAVNGQGVQPYRFERINEHNFDSQGWKEQEVNIVPGVGTVITDESDHLTVVCGPENDSDHRLIRGAVTMDLPTTAHPTLRRIRLRRGGYSGTYLAYLTELKYSTYLVHGSPTVMVLQIDVNGDDIKDFNIFYSPESIQQPAGFPPIVKNRWQQWDALRGLWHAESVVIPGVSPQGTIDDIVRVFPAARIIDTPPLGNNGEGVRFTVGGGPFPTWYSDNVSYFDDLIIGTMDRPRATVFDFTCDSSQ